MSLKHGLMGLLWDGERTGYELDAEFRQSLNFFWQAQTSQVYRELAAMEKEGWIETRTVVQTDRPNRKVCRLTDTGRQELLRWLSSPMTDAESRLRSGYLLRVFFGDHLTDEEFLHNLTAYEDWNRAQLEALHKLDFYQCHGETRMERARFATVTYGDFYYNMNIEWCKKMRTEWEEAK